MPVAICLEHIAAGIPADGPPHVRQPPGAPDPVPQAIDGATSRTVEGLQR